VRPIFFFSWMAGITLWALVCTAGWYVTTRDDYAHLAAATSCYKTRPPTAFAVAWCAKVKPSDTEFYKAAIDRKAALSRLAAAFGAMGALVLWFLVRSRVRGETNLSG